MNGTETISTSSRLLRRRSVWSSLLLVLVAAATLAGTSIIQQYYSQKGIRMEADSRAKEKLVAARLEIMDVVNQAEAAVRNSEWIAEWCLHYQDSLSRVAWRVVHDNPVVMGSTVALVPGYSKRYPLFAPYWHNANGEMTETTLATEAYDYPSQEWFRMPLELKEGYWSEPYVDEGGGGILMTTYSVPVFDEEGVLAAILTADISLDWLTDMLSRSGVYAHSWDIVISREGKVMASPLNLLPKSGNIMDLQEQADEPEVFAEIGKAMLEGREGVRTIHQDGELQYVYFAPVERTGWSLSVVIPESSLYMNLRRVSRLVNILQTLGLIMLIFILWAVFRNFHRYQDLNERKERMEGELQTARNIQMSMIPKTSFPEREDIDMAGIIIPAREVGGDLYDFFLRDDKLFFCIGDVSGKGVPASLLMAVTRSLFRSIAAREDSPRNIVSSLNNSIAKNNDDNMFVTFFCGVLEMNSGILSYCNAGHNAPLIFTDKVEQLPVVANFPLGVVEDASFEEQSVPIHYDDALFLYTDGVTEAENTRHQLFGLERMEEVLHERRNAMDHLQAMRKSLDTFVGEAPQSDDITMLFLHFLNTDVTPEGGGMHLLLHNDIRQISRLAQFMETVAREKNMESSLEISLNLALEEAVTNVIMYAYPQGTDGLVDIEAVLREGAVDFIIRDDGTPFDPTAAPEADVSLGVKDRPIGGLGIYLVRHIMDKVSYERIHGRNVLTMTKNI